MPSVPRSSPTPLAADVTLARPLIPTLVVASFKGGVWKTSISVAVAERLAFAGAKVLLVTCDIQEDARARLGVKRTDPQVALVPRGSGSVTVVAARDSKAIDLLYRSGMGLGTFNLAVLDTPPELRGGTLPGVFLVTPVDGIDAARNLVTMMRHTPSNTAVHLVKVGQEDASSWEASASGIEEALGRQIQWLPEPLPRANPILRAHNEAQSVWSLPRRGLTKKFLEGIDTLAYLFWALVYPGREWPAMPSIASAVHIPDWDEDDAY